MKFQIYILSLGLLFFALGSCSSDENRNGASKRIVDEASQIREIDNANPAASRVINLPPGPITQGTSDTDLLPFDEPEPLDEIVQTVADDGTLTMKVGNRFVRPLSVHIGCSEKLVQSHDEPVSHATIADCGEDLQAEEKR